MSRSLGFRLAVAWVAAVFGVSLAAAARDAWIAAVAASPDRIREGKLWFLLSSAVLVDRPVVVSLVSFSAFAALALLVCGPRRFWLSAFVGQVVATSAVYAFIGAARSVVPGAFQSAMASPDYGVSTISAAWLGTVAAVAWRKRGRSVAGKSAIALSCSAVGVFAYTVRPDVTVLSSEHLVAFGLGLAAATKDLASLPQQIIEVMGRLRARFISISGGRLKPAQATMVALAPVVCAIAVAPTGLSALRHDIVGHRAASLSRCAEAWNRRRPGTLIGVRPSSGRAFLSIVHRPNTHLVAGTSRRNGEGTYCRYVFPAEQKPSVVLGKWNHGHVDRWSVIRRKARLPQDLNARLKPDGQLQIRSRQRHGLTLSS